MQNVHLLLKISTFRLFKVRNTLFDVWVYELFAVYGSKLGWPVWNLWKHAMTLCLRLSNLSMPKFEANPSRIYILLYIIFASESRVFIFVLAHLLH